ncbi:MAG: tape measure protein, partial [Prevotellaceae bacterium]|nr:tape measure protein [Prevotellaceae bacterium]
GTGKTIEEVGEVLNELNTYADKTIYSLSDMTDNLSKFTNAGVDIDKAKDAIMGISNAAALAGASSSEASRAMYN